VSFFYIIKHGNGNYFLVPGWNHNFLSYPILFGYDGDFESSIFYSEVRRIQKIFDRLPRVKLNSVNKFFADTIHRRIGTLVRIIAFKIIVN